MNWTRIGRTAWNDSVNDLRMMRRHEWLTAMICAKKTAAWRDIGMSENIADKLRAGWAIFEALRKYDPCKARELRSRYSYRRFVDMGAGWVKYEFEAAAAIDHMESELSNGAMVMAIRSAHDLHPEWYWHAQGAYKTIDKLITDLDTDPEIITWAKQGVEIMKRKGIAQ
jgi:hypothetical protein